MHFSIFCFAQKADECDFVISFSLIHILAVKEIMLPRKSDSAMTVTKLQRQSLIMSLINVCAA